MSKRASPPLEATQNWRSLVEAAVFETTPHSLSRRIQDAQGQNHGSNSRFVSDGEPIRASVNNQCHEFSSGTTAPGPGTRFATWDERWRSD